MTRRKRFSRRDYKMSNKAGALVSYVFFVLFVFAPESWLRGQSVSVPDVGETGRRLVSGITGVYMKPPEHVPTDKMAGGPVIGNGDLGVVVGGPAEKLTFYLGKADFFGVIKGGVAAVGSLNLSIPELENASSYLLKQNVGPANITGEFVSADGAKLSLKSWVAREENLLVLELKNSGSKALTISSKLSDGMGTPGNATTMRPFGVSQHGVSLKVSPDIVDVELGNRLYGRTGENPGKSPPLESAFKGEIADFMIYNDALPPNTLESFRPMAIFPGWAIGLESSEAERKAALDTITLTAHWFDFNDQCAFYAAAALAGYDPREILGNLHELIAHYAYPNFIIEAGGGGTENFAVTPAALGAMFIQSYQRDIHVFANWPMDWDAAFGNLNACGGFLISSALKGGKIEYVKIKSIAGQECGLVNPWPETDVDLSSNRRPSEVLHGVELRFPIQAGEEIILSGRGGGKQITTKNAEPLVPAL